MYRSFSLIHIKRLKVAGPELNKMISWPKLLYLIATRTQHLASILYLGLGKHPPRINCIPEASVGAGGIVLNSYSGVKAFHRLTKCWVVSLLFMWGSGSKEVKPHLFLGWVTFTGHFAANWDSLWLIKFPLYLRSFPWFAPTPRICQFPPRRQWIILNHKCIIS